jgi:hypothetical protein
MSISQLLCEVRDRDFGGEQKAMAEAWGIYQSTLSRWIRRDRVPDPTWYSFLAGKFGISISEIYELCMADREAMLAASSAEVAV